LFRSRKTGIPPLIRLSRVEEALKYYNLAVATAITNMEKSSAYKNMAVAHRDSLQMIQASGIRDWKNLYENAVVMMMHATADALGSGEEQGKPWNCKVLGLAVGALYETSSVPLRRILARASTKTLQTGWHSRSSKEG